MSDGKPSLRIDWFDGTLIEDTRPNTSVNASEFADEDLSEPQAPTKPAYSEKKPIGFKRLLDLSLLQPPTLTLEIAHRPGFWNLLDGELKGDFIVLIVKILSNIYKSLETGEKSKITTMLKNRFEKSNFLEILKEFLIGLPSVRVVEKKMNLHLWNDIQAFYFDVLSLCEGIVNFGGNSIEYLQNVNDLLEILATSAVGVKQEHTESFSESFFSQIVVLESNILGWINEKLNSAIPLKNSVHYKGDKNSFKNLSIFPSKEDLLQRNSVIIQPNIINGAYPSIEHYLDLQFKLLREDCFGPLRDGICKYLENPARRRHENIRVHPKVRIIRTYITNNKVGHLVDVAWEDRFAYGLIDSKKYAYNKQLMFGSLLLFTSDNFESILCATVLDSSLSLLNEGYVAVSFQNPVSQNIFCEPYLMVESEVFFEPYHRVLKVLQTSRLDDLPMRKYIVDVEKGTHPPSYLTPETMYTVQEQGKSDEISFPVHDTDKWPKMSFGLDNSQMEAFKFALTREFAVIQGPPGTGKTFLGVKIASTLLKNLSLDGTPMLIICYTNHALDQFLEAILNVTTNIVRLGSQSKSKIIEEFTLNNMRSKTKCKYSYLYASKRSELEKIFKQMTELQTEIEKCEKEIVSYKSIRPYLKVESKVELRGKKEDPILTWLFSHLGEETESLIEEEADWEEQVSDLEVSQKIETCFSEEWGLKEIDSMRNSIKYVKDVADDHCEGQKMADKFESEIKKVRKRLRCFKRNVALTQDDEQVKEMEEVEDLNSLTSEERWRLYLGAVGTVKNELMSKMNVLLEEYSTCSQELNEVATLTDGEVMKTARVVGVTTTTAARRHDLMKKLHSPIVIVEEAAEVLEAHIVASLTHQCQHLILIGDHKQLRPTTAHYKLAKDCNLEISLFERMIRNGVHARALATQRRMRPSFIELLVPAVYDVLDSHPSVYSYPDVRGMNDNLYFYSHDVFEDSEGLEDSWSHKNTLEAKWCVALAYYLRQMNYKLEDITILATYTGQASLIKELSKKYKLLHDIKVTVVDNFQGEESRIVILSLVRSNREGKIGFVSATNRICVALSRAKEGFYMFGNMNVLKSASPLWRFINDKLVAQNAIGNKLTLRCDTHINTLEVQTIEDLDDCCTGCLRICENK